MPAFACRRGVPYGQEDADIVCPAILEVVAQCGGAMDKDDIVAAARSRNSPLHAYVFNKTRDEAAEAYYRSQANKLLKSFDVVWVQGGQQRRSPLVYYVELLVHEDEDEAPGDQRRNRRRRRAWVTATTALEDPAYQQQILAKMEQDLAEYQRRYEEFACLLDFRTRFGRVFRSICRLFEDAA